MPLDTRTKAKGIPPRGHLPPKGKKAAKKSSSQKNAKNKKNKRTVDSDSDESDDTEKSNVGPVVGKKKPSKWWRGESESEAEVIDEDVEPPEDVVEEVDGNAVGNDESEVSMAIYWYYVAWTHQAVG